MGNVDYKSLEISKTEYVKCTSTNMRIKCSGTINIENKEVPKTLTTFCYLGSFNMERDIEDIIRTIIAYGRLNLRSSVILCDGRIPIRLSYRTI